MKENEVLDYTDKFENAVEKASIYKYLDEKKKEIEELKSAFNDGKNIQLEIRDILVPDIDFAKKFVDRTYYDRYSALSTKKSYARVYGNGFARMDNGYRGYVVSLNGKIVYIDSNFKNYGYEIAELKKLEDELKSIENFKLSKYLSNTTLINGIFITLYVLMLMTFKSYFISFACIVTMIIAFSYTFSRYINKEQTIKEIKALNNKLEKSSIPMSIEMVNEIENKYNNAVKQWNELYDIIGEDNSELITV